MTLGLLGELITGVSDLGGHAIESIHHTTDSTLDATGLSAFLPPVLHEAGDAVFGISRDGVRLVGHRTGDALKTLDKVTLHGEDKSIGGNQRKSKGSSKSSKDKNVKICPICEDDPCVGGFSYCSQVCADIADARAKKRKAAKRKAKD